jgi:ribosome modulation factor
VNDQVAFREKRRQELGEVSFAQGAQGGALMLPTNGRELMDMANMMSASGQMVRDFYRNNPGDCAALIMICQPYGFNPFMVSWKTYKASKNADAPIAFEGQLVNAMVNMSAPVRGRLRYSYDGDGPMRRCTVTGIDRETGDEIVYTSPPVKDIPIKNSPLWKADPDQQLGYYSARAWARRHFPELLLGVYTREEIEEAPIRDVTPREATPLQRKIAEARGQVMDAPPPVDDEIPDTAHWTDENPGGGFPGSDEFGAGVVAFQAGQPARSCPYEEGTGEAADWLTGWYQAREATE